jgi:glycosyltransferase involved in cell wall biosynthesis
MKRILFISRCPPWPLYLGDRLILYHLGQELALRNYHLDLLAFADRATDWEEQGHYDMDFQHVELFPEPSRGRLAYLNRVLRPSTRWPTRAEDSWSPEMWRAIQQRLREHTYDVVHLFGGIQVYEFARALGDVPTVITPYESYSLYLRRALASQPLLRLPRGEEKSKSPLSSRTLPLYKRFSLRASWYFARRFESFMFNPYGRTVVVSEPDRDELLALHPALKVDFIPNGVDIYDFKPRPVKRIPALLFVGNYEYAPNVDAAMRLAREIFPAVQARIPGVRLWLVGNAPPPEMQALASEHIRVTGRVPDVRPYLARAGALVSPLRLGAGIKNKVLEALAMGCPVIASPLSVDGIHVVNGQDALIADGEAMVEAIVRVLGDSELSGRLSTNGARLIREQYSWGWVAEQYIQLYDLVGR